MINYSDNRHSIQILAITTAVVLGLGTVPAYGAVGDILQTFDAEQVRAVSEGFFCSIGLAFDGEFLYFDFCSDNQIYKIRPDGTGLSSFASNVPENPNAMAYDSKRNGLWIGGQGGIGLAGQFSCTDTGPGIYFYDFDDSSTTLMFNVPSSLVNPATGGDFHRFCFVDGLAYNENDPTSDLDDEIWYSDDVDHNLALFDTSGNLIQGYDASTVDASIVNRLSGLAIGGGNLYIGNNGLGDVFRADRTQNPLTLVDQFVSGDDRQEDMECVTTTFAPVQAMWVRTTPQGGANPNVAIAYEIEQNTCGVGGQPPATLVGGSIIPIDNVALVFAGLQTSGIWMLPILAGAVGTGIFIVRSKIN